MYQFLRFFLVTLFIQPVFANANQSDETQHGGSKKELSLEEQREKNTEFVKHHTQDTHFFAFFSNESEGTHYGFALPVILWDNGLHVFMSSELHHGEAVVNSKGNFYKLDSHTSKIYKTNAEGEFQHNKEGKILNAKPLDLSITKNVFLTLLMGALMFFLFKGIAKSYRSGLAPKGAAKFFEPIVLFIRDDIAIPNIGEKNYKKYMNYLLTVFFFIWFTNLLGMTPFGVNITGNIALTFALAIFTFAITHLTSKKDYWMHIFWMPGVPVPMKIILIPIELIGIFVKPFALMIRLYANMLAGHIVLGSLIAAVFYFQNYGAKGAFLGLTFFMNIIELLVALLQAYIFTMLTALYFGSASAEHEHEHEHGHEHAELA